MAVVRGDKEAEFPNPICVNNEPSTGLKVDAYPIRLPISNRTAAELNHPLIRVWDQPQKTTIRLIPFGAAQLSIAQFLVAALEN